MIITAKFAAVCPCCSGRINAGDKIDWSKGAKAKHAGCAGATTKTAPRAVAYSARRQYASKRTCRTGGNCSSFGSGHSCGADDCDGF